MIDRILSTIAPHICSVCSEYGAVLCGSCKYDIENEDFGRCIWCLRPTASMHLCTSCLGKTSVRGAWVVGERTTGLKQVLNDYKFESRREAARSLAALLDSAIPSLPEDTVVTWVPTSPSHIRARGFDHAALLARKLARIRRFSARRLLTRHHSLSQHELSRSAREEAAQQAFGLDGRSTIPPSVLLVDDILTTGATMRACSGLLSAAGADVYVAVIARQPLDE